MENESLSYKNSWKPISGHSDCSLSNSKPIQTEKSIETKVSEPYANKLLSSHQQIETAKKGDGLAYHCFNRADEAPFHRAIKNNNEEKIEENWVKLVNEPCKEKHRRCLGKGVGISVDNEYMLPRVDYCVLSESK